MMRLTNSEMKTYQRCRRKWWLSTYRQLGRKEPDEFNKPLSIGSRLHDALAQHYLPGNLRLEDEALWKYFDARVEEDVESHPVQADDIRKEADLCRAMLEGYFDWLEETGADADFEVIAPEAELEVFLIPEVNLLSKIDVRVKKLSDGHRFMLEHKSVGSLTTPVRKLQVDSQLLTEHLVDYLDQLQNDPDPEPDLEPRVDGVLYNMIRKVKRTVRANPPFYAREEVHHSVEELRNHWRHCAGIAREILQLRMELDGGAEPHLVCPPHVTGDCHWDCEFAAACLGGMFDDGSDVEGYLEEHFKVRDPLERYASQNPNGKDIESKP